MYLFVIPYERVTSASFIGKGASGSLPSEPGFSTPLGLYTDLTDRGVPDLCTNKQRS